MRDERWKILKVTTFYFLMYQYILHKNSNGYNFYDFQNSKMKIKNENQFRKSNLNFEIENEFWFSKMKIKNDFQNQIQKWKSFSIWRSYGKKR